MLRHRRLFWWGCGLLAVGVAFLVIPPYQGYCRAAHGSYSCAPYELAAALGHLIKAYDAAITALATIAIAGFTLTLWLSSEKMWKVTKESADAAKLNAQAVIDAERAHLYVVVVQHDVVETISAVAGAKYSADMAKRKMNAPFLAYVFRNAGKTPAILEEVMHYMTVQKTEKHQILYEAPEVALEILKEGEESERIDVTVDEPPPFLAEDARAISDDDSMLFFYSAATFRDIFNRKHKIRHDFLYSAGRFHLINRIEQTNEPPKHDADERVSRSART